jgi:hypothetical protein
LTVLALLNRLFGSSHQAPTALGERAREDALGRLARHGVTAHYYVPAAGCEDQELAAALRLLASRGYVMADAQGAIVGKWLRPGSRSASEPKPDRKSSE